jgi:imidazolonepropionase-like amidohydrolase
MSGIYNVYERERRAENKRVADMLWEMVKPQPEAVAKAFKAGVLIGTGTDTLGFTHQEVEMFTQCGMSPEQALRAATYDSARILGRETELGSVAPGKKADLVLLEGDPVKELSALKRVRTVILNGRIVTWDYLITGDGRS